MACVERTSAQLQRTFLAMTKSDDDSTLENRGDAVGVVICPMKRGDERKEGTNPLTGPPL